MSTIADFNISPDTWVDVYALTGITLGSAITILNKSSTPLIIFSSTSSPPDDHSGYILAPYKDALVASPTAGCFIRGEGTVSIQRATDTIQPASALPSIVTMPLHEIENDAGRRLRVSSLTTLFDGKVLGADDTAIWENVGTGIATFSNNSVQLSVATGQYMVRRGKHVCPYFSGKSQLVECTFDNFHEQTGITKRIGYFSSNAVAPYNTSFDGIWLENDGTTVRLRIDRSGVQIADIAFEQWDNYSLLSSYNWQNFTVAFIDFLWLGGTEVRLFIKTDNGFVLAHTFKWASTSQGTFILTPNHSMRYEIRSSSGVGTFTSICSQVATEGSLDEAGKKFGIINTSAINTNSVGTIYALLGVKKLAAFRDISAAVDSYGVSNTGNADQGLVLLLLNPTLSAPLSYTTNGKLSQAIATTQTITSSGRILAATPAGTAGSAIGLIDNYLSSIAMNIQNVSDEVVLAYMPTSANQSVFGYVTIKEF